MICNNCRIIPPKWGINRKTINIPLNHHLPLLQPDTLRQLILKYHEPGSLNQGSQKQTNQLEFRHALSFIRQWRGGDEFFEFNTSGSTGQPKTIRIERWKMELSAQRTIDALGLSENMTALLCMSPAFIGGAMMIVRALMARMNLTIVPAARQPFEQLTVPFDFTAMVPMQLSELLESGTKEQLQYLDNAQHLLLGGAGVSNKLLKKIESLKTTCWSTYGMTETVSHIALKQLNGSSPDKNFKVLNGVRIKTGDKGQLCIRDRITNDQWLETNDMVDIINEKEFVWLGRLDNVINTGGVKVMTDKVEMGVEIVMQEAFPNSRYFIAGTPSETYGTVVTLFLEHNSLLDDIDLLEKIKKESPLSKYEFPKRLVILKSFPETDSGKIDKQRILKSQS